MNAIHQFSHLSGWLWANIADHLWQSAIVVALAVLASAAASRSPARIRYRIWLVAAAKLAIPSVALAMLLISIRVIGGSHIASAPSPPAQPAAQQVIHDLTQPFERLAYTGRTPAPLQEWILGCLSLVWLAGVVLTLANWLRRRRKFLFLIRGAVPPPDSATIDALKRAKAAAGVERDVALVVSDRAVAPGVWGVWRPIIVLPDRVAHELSYDELEAVLVHELVHVQRRDNLVSNLTMILYSLFWFFPAMWLVDRKLLLERERACDERALETGASPRTYASAILKVSRF